MSSKSAELAEGVAYGIASGAIMGINQSLLHRRIHGSVELSPLAEEANEFSIWALSGMDRAEYEAVHLGHHAATDTKLTDEEWEQKVVDWEVVKQQYPGAPSLVREAFEDAHSPIQEGYLKVMFGNIPLYRHNAEATVPFLRALEAADVPRQYWPVHLQGMDLTESWMERNVYHRKNSGMVGIATLTGIIAAKRGPWVAAAFLATHVSLTALPGGAINSLGHLTGETFWEKAKVFVGLKKPQPDENGSYARNFLKDKEGIIMGEPKHGDHHKHPENPYIASDSKLRRDPTGVLIKKLVERGLAKLPTTRPTKSQQAA